MAVRAFGSSLAISRDGRLIVYLSAPAGGEQGLNVRALDAPDGLAVRGAENGFDPFLSPDGQWLGFTSWDRRELFRVPIAGGTRERLAEVPTGVEGASWGDDDRIVFGTGDGGLFAVPAGGGQPSPLTALDSGRNDGRHVWPSVIPGREAVVFVVGEAGTQIITDGQLAVLDLTTGGVTLLGLTGTSPQYVSTGHLVYATGDGSLEAVSFDVDRLEVTGGPVSLVDAVVVRPRGGAHYAVSDTGTLVSVGGDGELARGLVWVDRRGGEEPVGAPLRFYRSLSISPDGARVAVGIDDGVGNSDVWISELARGTLTRLTMETGFDGNPLWHADGRRIVFESERNGQPELFIQPADGTWRPSRCSQWMSQSST